MLIRNARVVSWEEPNQILEDHALLIEDGLISQMGPSEELSAIHQKVETLDAGGQYVMPGNICAHTHFYGAFARGMAIPGNAPQNFPEILGKLWWPLDKALNAEDVRYSTLVCLIDAIKHGTTTLIDHHASPNAIEGSLDVIAEAVEQAGVRAVLCYEVTDRDGKAKAKAGIEENLRFARCQSPTGVSPRHSGCTRVSRLGRRRWKCAARRRPTELASISMLPRIRPIRTTAWPRRMSVWSIV
jgi:cytosine/adenosine deaminase-related metal-dependent hydrolase